MSEHRTTHNSQSFRADRLIARRKALGIKSWKLAQNCGISAVQMSRIERGTRGVTVDMLVRLAKELRVTSDWLIGIDD